MTSPMVPSGADEAGDRNRAAVDQLETELLVPVRVAVYAVLADLLDDLDTTGNVVPSADATTAIARASWRTGLDRIVDWIRDAFTRLLTRAVDNGVDQLDELVEVDQLDDDPGRDEDADGDGMPDRAPDVPAATIEDRVSDLLDDVTARLREVPDTMSARVTAALREGYDQGETPDELRQRVADVLDRDEWDPEVERIARTTTTTVYNAAHTAAANELERSLGQPLQRMWIATGGKTGDGRTRKTHREAHAQVIESGGTFRVGDARLRFPGDPLGPNDEVINCRCVAVPVADDIVIDLAHRVSGRNPMSDQNDDQADVMPMAAAGEPGTVVVDEYSDDYRVDDKDVPGITAEDLDAAEYDDDGVARWPVDPDEFPEADDETLTALSRVPPALRRYWLYEEGAGEIGWGTEGSFRRCQSQLREHVSPAQLDGLCANLYHMATGRWPGQRKGAATTADADTGASGGCGCDEMTDAELSVAAAALLDANREHLAAAFDIPVEMLGPLNAANAQTVPWTVPCTVCEVDIVPGDHSDSDCRANIAAAYVAAVAPHTAAMARRRDAREAVPTMSAATLDDARSGAMVALVPSEADAARLAVTGDAAIPAEELHLTLLFLGDGADWEGTDQGAHMTALAEAFAADTGPITGRLWQVGTTVGQDPVAMYLVGDDTGRLDALHTGLEMAGEIVPPQHSPFVAHISTRYGDASTDGMDQGGTDVVFDRLRVSYGPENVDFPLSGADSVAEPDDDADQTEEAPMPEENPETPDDTAAAATAASAAPVDAVVPMVSLAAAVAADTIVARAADNAPENPPAAWFRPVQVDGPTPPTVTAEGRVWGHIGQSVGTDGTVKCHVGITDECVPIPGTRTNYGAFHRGELVTAEGDTVSVGYLYAGCQHSDLGMDLDQARDYLDAACTRTAAGRVYDTEWGPMFVGSVLPGARPENVAALWKLSGEWFTAPLELHAAVAVTDAGFPVEGTGDAVRVADVDPEPLAASADTTAAVAEVAACKCPAGAGCPCGASVIAADRRPDGDTTDDEDDDQVDDQVVNAPPEDVPAGTSDDPADDRDDDRDERPVTAVAAIDQYRHRAARRTTDPAIAVAANRRALRRVGNYRKRG